MAAEVTVRISLTGQPSSDWIALDATASFRLDSDSSAAFSSPSEVTTTALTTAIERYEEWDSSGTVDSTWYRFRIEDNADAALSDWTVPFQVLPTEAIATLSSVKLRLGSGATAADDDILMGYINAVNGAITQRIEYYPGPSVDTSRTYHGRDALAGGRKLWIPGGVRGITTMTIAGSTGASATAVTAGDFVLGPLSYSARPGEPYHYIEFVDVTAGNWGHFPYGFENVNITSGLFGWGTVPADLVAVASAWAIRQWKSRASGDSDTIGTTEFGEQIISDRFPAQWRRTVDAYRFHGIV